MAEFNEGGDLLDLEEVKMSEEAKETEKNVLSVTVLATALQALEVPLDGIDLSALTEETAARLQSNIFDAIAALKRHEASAPAPTRTDEDTADEWVPYGEDTHVPSFSIDSPVIMNVLSTWSDEEAKRDYFLAWARGLKKPSGSGYPAGIQITRVSKVLRDAFLMLVFPVLKQMCADRVEATVREHSVPAMVAVEEMVLAAEGREADLDMHLNSDPFVGASAASYDLRFKRVGHHARSTSEDVHHSTEADNFSPLSEINSVFRDLEHHAKEEMLAHELHRQQRQDFTAQTRRPSNDNWTHSLTAWLNPSTQAANRRSSFSDFLSRPRGDAQRVVDSYGSKRSFSVGLEAGASMAAQSWWSNEDAEEVRSPSGPGRSVSVDNHSTASRSQNKSKIEERLAALRGASAGSK